MRTVLDNLIITEGRFQGGHETFMISQARPLRPHSWSPFGPCRPTCLAALLWRCAPILVAAYASQHRTQTAAARRDLALRIARLRAVESPTCLHSSAAAAAVLVHLPHRALPWRGVVVASLRSPNASLTGSLVDLSSLDVVIARA